MSDEAGERSLFEDIFPFTGKPENPPQDRAVPDIRSIDRAACLIGDSFVLAEGLIEAGIRTDSLAEEISSYLQESGADFGTVIRISPENIAWHGMPGNRKLLNGEIVTIDVACSVGGWWADSARSFAVGQVDSKRRNLLLAAWKATACAVEFITAGYDGTGIHDALEKICHNYGVSLVNEGAGHGIGSRIHEMPSLTYDGRRHAALKGGLVYTAEPIITSGTGVVIISPDGEAVTADNEPSAHFEVSVLSLAQGNQVLGNPEWFYKTPC